MAAVSCAELRLTLRLLLAVTLNERSVRFSAPPFFFFFFFFDDDEASYGWARGGFFSPAARIGERSHLPCACCSPSANG